ncbi:hypothetical protein CHCC14437_0840 [Bacillus licheniformis]|nr:hypothetical protein CHCC14437_0840 [Bacillus licheniformis]
MDKQRRFFRIEADRQIQRGKVPDVLSQREPVLRDCDRVLIDDAEVTVVVILQVDKLLHRSDIVAEGDRAARLDTGKNRFFHVNPSLFISK